MTSARTSGVPRTSTIRRPSRRRLRADLRTWGLRVGLSALLPGLLLSCSLDSLLNNDKLPPNVTDPAITLTPTGALAIYNGAILKLQAAVGGDPGGSALASFIPRTGLFTDELDQLTGTGVNTADPINQRTLFGRNDVSISYTYAGLHKVRGQAGQAIQLLTRYVPEQPALAGHMYALDAYAEILLAEFFCSGIPLSTLDYAGDYTYQPGSTTAQVFIHALALLDTGLTLAADSARFVHLIHLAQGRALLSLGRYADAAAAVAAVPDGYTYTLSYNAGTEGHREERNFASYWGHDASGWQISVANLEGGTGLDYQTSADPRTLTTLGSYSSSLGSWTGYRADKYDTTGATPIVLASGTEARLIQAEAALQAGDASWLTKLNVLRTDGTFDVDTQVVSVDNSVTPPDTTFAYDTLWHAGTGGVAGLAPLADPGTAADRVDLLFRERAFWLFLTGHRQGDLRRLIREYGRDPETVYPTGEYPIGGNFYGTDVVAPIPADEQLSNPLFTGCVSTGA